MDEIITILVILSIIVIVVMLYFKRSNVRDNGSPINEARDNNRESKDINIKARKSIDKLRDQNKSTIDITRELKTGNTEARELNNDIREANKTAGDIIAEVRKQKLDR